MNSRQFIICFISLVLFVMNCRLLSQKHPQEGKDFTKHEIEWGGKKRQFYVHVPFSKDLLNAKIPLVVMLHGRFGSGLQVMEQTNLNAYADQEKFMIVYPDGYKRSWADGRGNTPADQENVDDVGFLEKLVERLIREYPVDGKKVFVAGHSNGGFMTQRLLVERSGIFVGGFSVAAHLSMAIVKKYVPSKPVSVGFMLGTGDPLVPYYGGYVRDGGEILSATDSFDVWKHWNGCSSKLVESHQDNIDDLTTVDFFQYSECKENTITKLIRINEGGHSWPGQDQRIPFVKMGNPTKEVDGAKEMISFFKEIGMK
ncbi:hypothetical protein EHQ58_09935 [Leptospira ognonensis]|uniref:Hydrolase n=1 Tax=Leptospira ognonensis TaxID=2484945 RepID=A0A4R9K0N3_9LEPT|nr:PHB depolymerase family esterase [Leptospira ognonensis]TGL59219.1 hypothetical protein EHQ58_09935 [Leptospira ognonensis]